MVGKIFAIRTVTGSSLLNVVKNRNNVLVLLELSVLFAVKVIKMNQLL